MRIAYFSPLPPSTSGIADYSALLLPALEQLVDVEIVRPGRTRPVADADVALYHIGNDPDAHGWILDALRRRSGVVVLHDFVVHHLMAGATIGRNDGHAYLAAMEREAGAAGRMLGWGVLEGRVPPLWEVRPTEFPLVGEILDRATGVVVHSRYVEAQVREHGYDGPLWVIPHPAWPTEDVEPADVAGAPLLGCFGHINANKRVPELLRAFAEFRRTHPDARLLLVGEEAPGYRLLGELPDGVTREPYVEEERLMALIAACDGVVLLRAPTMGETSGSAIRTLSLGRPLVVSDLGWFAELPDDVAFRVPVGDGEEHALVDAFEALAEPAIAHAMGDAAKRYVDEEHDLARVASLYVAALEESAGGAIVEQQLLHELAAAAADTGAELEPLAADLHELGIAGRAPAPVAARGLPAIPPWLGVGALYTIAVVVTLTLGLRIASPWIMVDELVYSDTARSLADGAGFTIRGVHAGYGYVYPLLLAIPYAVATKMSTVYELARVINALVMCSVVLPVYLLARHVVRAPAALAAAALALAVPPLVYVGTLMTENVFYPVFAWFALALVAALERPTPRRQVVLLALCALAFLTRAQAIVLVAVALTAPLVLAWIERGRPRRLAAWKPLYGIVVLAVVGIVVGEVAVGNSPTHVLGGYSVAGHTSYQLWPILQWVVYHLGAVDLSLWVIPAAALVVVVASARHLDRPLRVFAAATATLTAWLVLEVGVFASRFSLRLEERNLFYLAPLLVIALLAWIERGQPRPPRAVVAAALVAAALPGAIPFAKLLNPNSETDTPFLQTWWWLSRNTVTIAVVAVSLALAALFLWLSPRFAGWLPALVGVGFLLAWLPLQLSEHSFPRLAAAALRAGTPADRTWIDDVVGPQANVAVLWSGGDNPFRVWENEFWNRSVRRVYGLNGATLPGGMSQTTVRIDAATGALQPAPDAQYVLADSSVQLLGRRVAADPKHDLVLYAVRQPVRVTTRITGWYPPPDNWTGPHTTWTRAQCSGGTLEVSIYGDPNLFEGVTQHVRISGTTPTRTIAVPGPDAPATLRLPLTPRAGTCVVRLDPSPVRKPKGDPRTLGVHAVGFTYVP